MNNKVRRDFRRRLIRLLRHFDVEAPELILGMDLALLVGTGTVLFGNAYHAEVARRHIEMERQRHGLCQDCDTLLPPTESYPKLCTKCEQEAEIRAMQMESELEEFQ